MSPESPNLNLHSWARLLRDVKDGLRMHKKYGLLAVEEKDGKRERPQRNISWHCICQVGRVKGVGEWLGFPPDLIDDMEMAAFLHDYDKWEEILLYKELKKAGGPQLPAIIDQGKRGQQRLQDEGFSPRVVWLASAPGGLPGELTETYEVVTKPTLTNNEWAFLISHYVDDISLGAKCVPPSRTNDKGQHVNVVDDRAEGNKAKAYSSQSSIEVQTALADHPYFGGMNTFDAMAKVSHLIENRLAEEIERRTGEKVNPIMIPELIDARFRTKIESSPK